MTATNRRRVLISSRCEELGRLGEGWDGHGAEAPTLAALWAAEIMLDRWHIEPGIDGGLLLHLGDAKVIRVDRYGRVET